MMLFLALPALVCGLATYAFWAVPRGKNCFEDLCRRWKDKVSAAVWTEADTFCTCTTLPDVCMTSTTS